MPSQALVKGAGIEIEGRKEERKELRRSREETGEKKNIKAKEGAEDDVGDTRDDEGDLASMSESEFLEENNGAGVGCDL